MNDQNDHDILIEVQTMMKLMITSQAEFLKEHRELSSRVSALENKDSRDSEKFKGITDEIRRSLNNSGKIDTLSSDVNHLGEGLRDLKAKANLWDIGNSIVAAIAAALAWFR